MTEDVKATRLSKAAHEFNVGISTIVEFLHKKGYELDPNPNTKIPHEAYLLLVKEYSTDISAKKESEKLALKDLHRKKETLSIDDVSEQITTEESEKDDEILVKDSSGMNKSVDLKTDIKKPDITLIGKIDLDKTVKPKGVQIHEEAEKKPVKKVAGSEAADKKKTPATKEPIISDEAGKAAVDLHIVGKIDLDTVTGETKTAKKEKEAGKDEGQEIPPKEEAKKHLIEEPAEELADEEVLLEDIIDSATPLDQEEKVVELFRPGFEKLSGPTVVGKIDLPVEDKKKPAPYQPVKINGDSDFRRKKRRKRITKEKEQVPVVKPDSGDRKDKTGKKPLKKRPVRVEVDEEEVQKQIKETLARLTTKGKSKGSRYRREKRDAISQQRREVE
ncbi:MAG: hypothetical protein NT092_08020, partial [Bacteroidia bacterium]|nr:hypothetical protein [Bacteroidia bacterium]